LTKGGFGASISFSKLGTKSTVCASCAIYLRFYLKYVEPHRDQIIKGRFKTTALEQLDQWDTIMGLAEGRIAKACSGTKRSCEKET
jgi:hypothetical protein